MVVISQSRSGYVATISAVEMAVILGHPGVNSAGYVAPVEGDVVTVSTFGVDSAALKSSLVSVRSAITDMDAALLLLGV